MNVEQIMNQPGVCCRGDDTLNTAAGLMWDHDCGSIPVCDDEDRAIGMITDRDICMAAYTKGGALNDIPVSEAMSREIFACGPTDEVARAEQIMREHKIRRVPVVDEHGKVRGVLSLSDVVREAAREQGRRKRDIQADEVVTTLADISQPRGEQPAVSHAS